MIPGILFTYDPQLSLGELVHKQYRSLWPEMPVRFRVPVNGGSSEAHDYFERRPDCDLVRCPSPMSETAEALLQGFDDAEWVFWCIDGPLPGAARRPSPSRPYSGACTKRGLRLRRVKLVRPLEESFRARTDPWGGVPMKVQTARRASGFYHHHSSERAFSDAH
jgi:hypothetical protein